MKSIIRIIIHAYYRFLKFLLGKESFRKSQIEIEDSFALILNSIAFLVSAFYVIVLSIYGLFVPMIPIIIVFAGTVIGFILFRFGLFIPAKTSVLSLLYLTIYISSAADSFETAIHLYFFVLLLASYVVYGYKRVFYSLAFSIVTIILYLFSNLSNFSFYPEFNFNNEQIQFFFTVNSIVFTFLLSFTLYAYMRMLYFQSKTIKKKNEELKKTNEELDYLLYSTSHDLKAPLATMSGLIEIAKMTDSSVDRTKYDSLIKENIQKMDGFIEEVISIFKNAKLNVTKESVNPKLIVEELSFGFKDELMMKNIDLKLDLVDCEIQTDPMRLKSILRNLISNAIKYYDVQKPYPEVSVKMYTNDKSLVIDVNDNGIGIQDTENIFKVFYRSNKQVQGDGLGLFIAKEMSTALNATLEVNSELNKGSSFSLKVPLN